MNWNNNRLVRQFKKQFDILERRRDRGYDKIYVGIDIHETCMLPTWSTVMSSEFYPFAKEVLQLMSDDSEICMILWSCSLPELNKEYHGIFNSHGIQFNYINENPECASTEYADFDTKLYFSVGIDDKFGFFPEEDWEALYLYFISRRLENFEHE